MVDSRGSLKVKAIGGGTGHLNEYARYTGLGLQLALPVGLGCLAGYKLDAAWNTEPWLLVGGAVLGILVGFVTFFTTILKYEKREKDEQG